MSEVPYWEDIETSDNYINASPEEKLQVLDGWAEDRYAEMPNLDTESGNRFELGLNLKKEMINNPDASEDELNQGAIRRREFQYFDYRNRFERTRKRNARIHANSLGKDTYLNEEIVFNDAEKSWINDNKLNLRDSWVVRRGLDETDPNDIEVNYALAVLGKDTFTDYIRSQEDLSDGEQNRIIANFPLYKAGAHQDLFSYTNSKTPSTLRKVFEADSEDGDLDVDQNLMFMTEARLSAFRDKGSVEAEDKEALIDNIVINWASKRGLDEDFLLDRTNPLRDSLYNFYTDSLLERGDTWGKEEVVRENSRQEKILNTSWLGDLNITEEEVRKRVRESGEKVPEEVIEKFIYDKREKDDRVADQKIDAIDRMIPGDPEGKIKFLSGRWWTTFGQHRQFHNYRFAHKDKGWSSADLLRNFKEEHKGTTLIGKGVDFIESALSSVASILPLEVTRGRGAVTSFVDAGAGEELLEREKMARESFAVLDDLGGNTYGRLLGGEGMLLLTTMGGSGTARGLMAFTKPNVAKVGRNTKAHQAVSKRLDRLADNLENGDILTSVSRFKEITNRLAGGTYMGLQASRSATSAYSDSYFIKKDEMMAEGLSEEEASEYARKNSILPSFIAGSVTAGLMRLIPGGTEDLFRGIHKLTPKELASKLNISTKELKSLLKNPEFKKSAGDFLKEGGLKGLGRSQFFFGMGREALEEGTDELLQGVNAMIFYNTDLTMGEAFRGAADGAILGGILGGMVGGVQSFRTRNLSQLDPIIEERVNRLASMAEKLEGTNPKTAEALRETARTTVSEASTEVDVDSLEAKFQDDLERQISAEEDGYERVSSILDGVEPADEKLTRINGVVRDFEEEFGSDRPAVAVFMKEVRKMVPSTFDRTALDQNIASVELEVFLQRFNSDISTEEFNQTKRFILPKARDVLSFDEASSSDDATRLIAALDASFASAGAQIYLNRVSGGTAKNFGKIKGKLNAFLNLFNTRLEEFNEARTESTLDPKSTKHIEVAAALREEIKDFYKSSRKSYQRALKKTFTDSSKRNELRSKIDSGELNLFSGLLKYTSADKSLELPVYKDIVIDNVQIQGDPDTDLSPEDIAFVERVQNDPEFNDVDVSDQAALDAFVDKIAEQEGLLNSVASEFAKSMLLDIPKITTPKKTAKKKKAKKETRGVVEVGIDFRNWLENLSPDPNDPLLADLNFKSGKLDLEEVTKNQSIILWDKFSKSLGREAVLDPSMASSDIAAVFGKDFLIRPEPKKPAKEPAEEPAEEPAKEPAKEPAPEPTGISAKLQALLKNTAEKEVAAGRWLELENAIGVYEDIVRDINNVVRSLSPTVDETKFNAIQFEVALLQEGPLDEARLDNLKDAVAQDKEILREILGKTSTRDRALAASNKPEDRDDVTDERPVYALTGRGVNDPEGHVNMYSKEGVYVTASSFNHASGKQRGKSRRSLNKDEDDQRKKVNDYLRGEFPFDEIPPDSKVVGVHVSGIRDALRSDLAGFDGTYGSLVELDRLATEEGGRSPLYKYFTVEDADGNFIFNNNPYSAAAWLSSSKDKGERPKYIELPKKYRTKKGRKKLNPAFTVVKNKIISVKVNFPPPITGSGKVHGLGTVGVGVNLSDLHLAWKNYAADSKKKGKVLERTQKQAEILYAFDRPRSKEEFELDTLTKEELEWLGLPEDSNQNLITALEAAWKNNQIRHKNEEKYGKEKVSTAREAFYSRALLSILRTRLAKTNTGVSDPKSVWQSFKAGLILREFTHRKEFVDLVDSEYAPDLLGGKKVEGLFSTENTAKADLKYLKGYKTEGLEGAWQSADQLVEYVLNKLGSGTTYQTGVPLDETGYSMSMLSKAFEDIPTTPFDGLTEKTSKRKASEVRRALKELGLKEGEATTIIVALERIVEGSRTGKYPENYGEIARILLESGEIDVDNIDLIIGIEAKVAGYWKASKNTPGGTLALSDKKDNGRGVHDLLIHEVLHSVLDNIFTNPNPTPEQQTAILAIDALIDKGRMFFGDLVANRMGGMRRAYWQAEAEANEYDLEVIKKLINESESPIKEELNLSEDTPSDLDYRNVYKNIRLEELKGSAYYDDVSQLRHAFGVNPDGTFKDATTSRKEFITHFLTDPTTTWFLGEADRLSNTGSLWDRLVRTVSRGVTVDFPDERENFLRIFLNRTDGTENYIDHATIKNIRDITGLSDQDLADAREYRSSAPAFSGEPIRYVESQSERSYWENTKEASPVRELAASFNVGIFPSEDVEAPELMDIGTIKVPTKSYPFLERDIASKIAESAYARSFSRGRRSQVAGGMVQNSPEASDVITNMIVEAGSFEALVGDMVADAYYGADKSQHLGYEYPLRSLRNSILTGNFGQRLAGQLDTLLGAVDQVLPGKRSYIEDSYINDANSSHRIIASKAIRKFNLSIDPDTYVDLIKTSVESETSFEDLLNESFSGEEFNDQLRKIREYHVEQLESYSNSTDADTKAAAALEKDILGVSSASFSEPQKAFEVDEEGRRRGKVLGGLFKLPFKKEHEFERGDPLPAVLDALGVFSLAPLVDKEGNPTGPVRQKLAKLGIRNIDRWVQRLTVSGQAGVKFQRMAQELRNDVNKTSTQTRFLDKSIRQLIFDATGAKSLKELEDNYSNEQLELLWKITPDGSQGFGRGGITSAGAQLRADINNALGTMDDDGMVDDFLRETNVYRDPNYAETIQQEKLASIRVAAGIFHRKKEKAAKLKEDGQDEKARDVLAEATSERNSAVQEANDKHFSLWMDLYKGAANHFKDKQKDALKRLTEFDEYVINQGKGRRRELTKSNSLKVNVSLLRREITKFQKTITDSDLLVDNLGKNLPLDFRAKLGVSEDIYLTKTYQAHDDSSGYGAWIQSVDEDAQERYKAAYDHIADKLAEEKTDKFKPEERGDSVFLDPETGKEVQMTRHHVKKRMLKLIKPREVKLELQKFLMGMQKGPTGLTLGLSSPRVLKPRKPIDAPLRKFAGEYQDNIYNASRTLTTLATLVANNKFLHSVKDSLESAQLEAQRNKQDLMFISNKPAEGLVSFSAGGLNSDEQLGPLKGFYGPPNIVAGIQQLGREDSGQLLNALMKLSSFSMANLTSRRLRTHVRNFLGNPLFLVGAGMPVQALTTLMRAVASPITAVTRADKIPVIGDTFFGRQAGGIAFRNAAVASAGLTKTNSFMSRVLGGSEELSTRSEEVSTLTTEYAELGVTGQDMLTNIRKEIAEATGLSKADAFLGVTNPGKILRGPEKYWDIVDNALTQMYSAEDEFWKITSFEAQLTKLSSVFGITKHSVNSDVTFNPLKLRNKLDQITEEQIDKVLKVFPETDETPRQQKLRKDDPKAAAIGILKRAAAERVRLTMPNYSNTLDIVRWLKKKKLNALAAPFISFQAEVVRIMVDTPKLAHAEFTLGKRMKREGLRTEGNRMMRLGTARGLSWGATALAGAKAVSALATVSYTILQELLSWSDDEEFDFESELYKRLSEQPILEKDTKRFLSSWYRKGHVAVLDVDKEKGLVTWSDVSHLVPQSDITAPLANFIASFSGEVDETPLRAFRDAFGGILAPYFAKQVWIDGILGENVRESTLQEIDQSIFPEGTLDRIKELSLVALPGIVPDFYDVMKAMHEGPTMYKGKQITPMQTLLGAGFGQKIQTTDVPDSLARRIKFTAKGLQEAKRGFTDSIRGGTTQKAEDVRRETLKWQERRQEFIRRAWKDGLAAQRSLISAEAFERVLYEQNISANVKEMILGGFYTPSYLSESDYVKGGQQDVEFGTSGVQTAEEVLEGLSEVYFEED